MSSRRTPAPSEPPGPPEPILLGQLLTYAQSRLQAGAGMETLAGLGLDDPSLIASYGPGFLPKDYRDACGRSQREAFLGLRLGGRVILPATDEAGLVVDLLAARRTPAGETKTSGVHAAPQGLLGAGLISVFDDLLVVDTITGLAACWRSGQRNALLLRGAADAGLNAERLHRAGVRRAVLRTTRETAGIAEALQAAGIDLSGRTSAAVPSVVPAGDEAQGLHLVAEDRTGELVTAEDGPVTYTVEREASGDGTRHVTARCGAEVHQDRIILGEADQRQAFAASASLRVGVDAAVIERHLDDLRAMLVGSTRAERARSLARIGDADRTEAERLLSDPDLLRALVADLGTLGWLGEERSKALLLLTATSRLLDTPLWTARRCSGGAAAREGAGLVASLTPEEDRLTLRRIGDVTLSQRDPRQLRNRLLVLDLAEPLRPNPAQALRVLRERGAVGWAALAGDAPGEAAGPVAVIAAAEGPLDPALAKLLVAADADERPEHLRRVLAEDQRRRAGAASVDEAAIRARHHAVQRLLEPRPVVIPDAARLVFPVGGPRSRVELSWLMALASTIALIHQRQRPEQGGAVVASEADVLLAIHLSEGLLGSGADGLPHQAARVLDAIRAEGLAEITVADLARLLPTSTRSVHRTALAHLVDLGCLIPGPETTGRGNLRAYTLAEGAAAPSTAIHLLPPGQRIGGPLFGPESPEASEGQTFCEATKSDLERRIG